MPDIIKNYIYPKNEKNEFDSTTVVISNPKTSSQSINRVVLCEFKQVEYVANQLIKKEKMIVDLTQADINEARRICDFLNGLSFGLGINVEKISKLIYLFG